MRSVSLLVFASLLGCKEQPAKVEPAPAVTASASATPAPASASASASVAKAGHPATCEVEVFGKVVVPPKTPKGGKLIAYVAQDDCLADDAQVIGHVVAGLDGAIVIEVFPRWGSDITVCAARDMGEGKPTTLYGKAKRTFHAESEGELTFNDVTIELAEGKPHVFPKDSPNKK